MAVQTPNAPNAPLPPKPAVERFKSFLGWAFVISVVIHAVTLPFFQLSRPEAKKQEVEKVSVSKKIKVVVPTPPPPTPTPPPPTPPPKQTPPPVKQTNPPPQPKLKVNPPKTTNNSNVSSAEHQYVAPVHGSEEGNPQGNSDSAPPAPPATGIPATPAPTPAPPTPTPKPACANPNVDATTTDRSEPDYPEMAKEQGASGTVTVKVSLDANGGVLGTSIYKSSNFAALDQAAIQSAKNSRYAPEVVNCVKTAGQYLFIVEFSGQ